MTFKIGDKVVCVLETNSLLKKGNVYTVKHVTEISVWLNEIGGCFNAIRFTLLEENAMENCLKKLFKPATLKHTTMNFTDGDLVRWDGKNWMLVHVDGEDAYLLAFSSLDGRKKGEKVCVPVIEISLEEVLIRRIENVLCI